MLYKTNSDKTNSDKVSAAYVMNARRYPVLNGGNHMPRGLHRM